MRSHTLGFCRADRASNPQADKSNFLRPFYSILFLGSSKTIVKRPPECEFYEFGGPLPRRSALKLQRGALLDHRRRTTVKHNEKCQVCSLGGRTLHTCSSVGPFFKDFLMRNAYFSNTCPKYGGAWPFHSGFIVVAWWRPLGEPLGLWGSIWAKILNSSWRRPLGGLLGPLWPFLSPESCPTRAHLLAIRCPPRVRLVAS